MACADREGHLKASDYMTDGIAIFGDSDIPAWVDDGLYRTLGLGGDSSAASPADILRHIQFPNGRSLMDILAVIDDTGTWCGEAVGLTSEDHAIHLEVRGQRLDEGGASSFGRVLVFHNVARENMMAIRVSESQQMELVDKLSRGIAHEFKNLLTIIMAYGSLLEMELQDTEHADEVAKIMQTAERANQVVRRLTSLTRRPRPRVEPTDLYTVITEVNALLSKTLPTHLTLKAPEPRGMPMVQADAGSLIRAVIHLALNASEAMPDEGELAVEADVVEISAADLDGTYPLTTPGPYIKISVTDQGFGMTPDVQARLFEPFFTTKEFGTGLGMCYVREVIEDVGGAIQVRSQPGQGTTVTVYIPVLGGDGRRGS